MNRLLLFIFTIFSVSLFAQADIVVKNTDNQGYYIAGNTNTYSIVVTNNGPNAATNVTVNNPIPNGISNFVWTGPFDTAANDFSGGTNTPVNYTVSNLAVGQVLTFTVTISVPTFFSGNLTSTTTVTTSSPDPNTANNTSVDIDVEGDGADIVVTNTNNQSIYTSGQTTTYNVKVKNLGPLVATNVSVSNPIPAGITQFSWTGSNGSSGNNVGVTNLIASLAVGAEVNYTITAVVPATYTGNLVSSASASSAIADPDPSCIACVDTDVPKPTADIVVTNTDNENFYVAGAQSIYTVSVTNNGPDLATNVLVQNAIPTGITQFSWTGNGANGNNVALNNNISFLNVGQSVVYTITATIPASFTGNLVSTANATTSQSTHPYMCTMC